MRTSRPILHLFIALALAACNARSDAPVTEAAAPQGEFTPRNLVFDCNGKSVIATFDGENATVLPVAMT